MAGKTPESGTKRKPRSPSPNRRIIKEDPLCLKSPVARKDQVTENALLLEKFALTSPDILFVLDPLKKKADYLLSPFRLNKTKDNLPVLDFKETDFLDLLPEEDANFFLNSLKNSAFSSGEESGELEVRLKKNEREISYFQIRFTPYRKDEFNQVKEWFCQASDITETKTQLKELKDSRLNLQMALDGSGMGIWSYDPFSQKIECDTRTCSIFGLKPHEINVNKIFSILHPEEKEFALATAKNALGRKGLFNHDFRVVQPDSRIVKHIAVMGELITNEKDETTKITGVCFDISQNKLVENRMRSSEAFLEESQRIAKIGGFDWDLELDKVNLTSQMYSLLGITYEDPLNLEGFYKKVHPQDRKAVKETLMKTIRKGGGFSKEFRYVTSEGISKVLWAQGQVSMDANMRSTRLIGTIQDISEKKEKEKELNTLNLLIKSILHNLPVIVQIIEKNGTIRNLLGEVGLQRIGMNENQTVGQNIYEQKSENGKFIKQALKGETVNFTETVEYNGRLFHFLSYYFFDRERELAIGFSIDISAQKQTEVAFKEVSAKNRELESIKQVMDVFVYAAAHDLKNPVNNLQMLSMLLKEASTKQEQTEYLEALSNAVKRLKQTIGGLTEIIELENSGELQGTLLNFEDVLDMVLADLHPLLEEKKGKITTCLKETSIRYNKAFLNSILKNLISNSIKYATSLTPPVIQIKTERKNEYVLLSVSDNGIGIDLHQFQSKLFKPFRRFTTQAEGTGVGLHLIKSMVEKNGGYIEVESTPGKGTTFFCYLIPLTQNP